MKINTRRNRNIGTAKQGYGLKNKMKIPEPIYKNDSRAFYERLVHYSKQKRIINGHEFHFITETLNKDAFYACSIDDVAQMIQYIPVEDYGELKLIVFRQAKRKEQIIRPVWGRCIYAYEFENTYHPAIILESVSGNESLKWSKKMSLETRQEFDRLKLDGYQFVEHKRFFQAQMPPNIVRNTQLYRTLLHEFGHYVHYLNIVERPAIEEEEFAEWKKRNDYYFESVPTVEKEKFAHKYADHLKTKLLELSLIPFSQSNTEDLQ